MESTSIALALLRSASTFAAIALSQTLLCITCNARAIAACTYSICSCTLAASA